MRPPVQYGANVISLLHRLRYEVAAATVVERAKGISWFLKAGFDPNQPRVPVGSRGGGQWAGTGGSTPASAQADTADAPSGTSGPLKITIRPRAREDEGPPELPPAIPNFRPASRRLENRVARQTAGWLARAALRGMTGPIGTAITIIEAATWLHEHLPNMQSYFDPPKTLRELQEAVQEPKKGYDIHHIVEQGSAESGGFPRSMIDASENLVRIPRYKHWQLNSWFETPSKQFGGMSPRAYLRGVDWDERVRVGMDALIEAGVLKQ
jgi:hypothetical protein